MIRGKCAAGVLDIGLTHWYAYCDNNPLKHADPLGLDPPRVGDGFTQKETDIIYDMIITIGKTKRGGDLMNPTGPPVVIVPLKPGEDPFTEGGWLPGQPHEGRPSLGSTVHWSPGYEIPPGQGIPYFGPLVPFIDPQPYLGRPNSEQALMHELGHAYTGDPDTGPDAGDNGNRNENPIGREIGYPIRLRYRAEPAPHPISIPRIPR